MTLKGPNFFIVGAPKCGTTALYTYLGAHPDVFFPREAKEPHHFNSDMPGFRWFSDPSAYKALFDAQEAQAAKIRGDASVQYLYSKRAAEGIANEIPDARILISLRAPLPFIRSYHNQMLTNLDEDITDLRDAWQASGEPRTVAREASMSDYKSVGLFAQQVDRYRAVFPDEQIRILHLEDFAAQPREAYLALLAWLELDDDGRTEFPKVHGAVTPRSRSIARFLKSPPPIVRHGSKAIKRLTGLQSLGVARRVKDLNAAKTYGTSDIDAALAEEIESHYAQDQRELKRHADLTLAFGRMAGARN